jgi:hypothetical protein
MLDDVNYSYCSCSAEKWDSVDCVGVCGHGPSRMNLGPLAQSDDHPVAVLALKSRSFLSLLLELFMKSWALHVDLSEGRLKLNELRTRENCLIENLLI